MYVASIAAYYIHSSTAVMRSLVGKVRLNDQIASTPTVAYMRTKYNPPVDLIEIFNNTVVNDPSPPSKSIAALHRSSVNGVPCAVVLDQKILDYNNRDFYTWQSQKLVDSISHDWLRDMGGGIQLTVHRNSESVLNDTWYSKFHRMMAHARNRSYTKSQHVILDQLKSVNGHTVWKTFFEMRYFAFPVGRPSEIIHTGTDSAAENSNEVFVEGLSSETWLNSSDSHTNVLHVNKATATLYAQTLEVSPTYPDLAAWMKRKMMQNKCIEGVLYFESPNFSEPRLRHAFSIHQKAVNSPPLPVNADPLLLGPAFTSSSS